MSTAAQTAPTEEQIACALAAAREIAREAGDMVSRDRRSGISVESKGLKNDLVTDCDRRAEALIVGALRERFADHVIVGEESSPHGEEGSARPTWYVDPIDGTTNFAHGLPWYSVSLGFEHDGVRLAGVIYVPETGWEFTARRGGGAFLGDERLSVSQTTTLEAALVGTGFAYDRRRVSENNLDEFRAVLLRCRGLRRVGSAALDCAMVAAGWLDAYWELRINPWDVSAGALLVEEAGGRVSALDGKPFRSDGGALVASNGRFHGELLSVLAATRARREQGQD